MTAAGPLRGPGKGDGCAAAVLLAPAKGTGPLLRPQGCSAPPCGRRPCGPPLTPETTAAPGGRRSGQATACPNPASGRKKASPFRAGHQNESLHAFRGTPAQADLSAARRAEAVHLGIPAHRDIAAATLAAGGPHDH